MFAARINSPLWPAIYFFFIINFQRQSMTSILMNTSSMSALQSLRDVSASLQKIQGEVSSGLRVANAADDVAYWSISTTMRSDNKAISAATDALGLGAAKTDTAYAGMKAVIDVLGEFKAKLVTASESSVDNAQVQLELDALKKQVVSIAEGASFSGENWLNTAIPDIKDSTQNRGSVVSSFVRNSDGSVAVTSADIDLSTVSLFNATGFGLLQSDIPVSSTPSTDPTGTPDDHFIQELFRFVGPITLSASDSISFDLVVHPGGGQPEGTLPVTITQADVIAALGNATGTISDGREMSRVLYQVWGGNSLHVGSGANGQELADGSVNWHTFNIDVHQITDQPDSDIEIANLVSTLSGGAAGGLEAPSYYTWRDGDDGSSTGGSAGSGQQLRINFLDIDVTNGVGTQLNAVETMLDRTISAAASLGALQQRIDMQTDFALSLSDSIETGVGRLVDADMEEASAHLQAVQTRQQLAVQSLQISNSAPQNILSLFN